jgi:hypothetical protein
MAWNGCSTAYRNPIITTALSSKAHCSFNSGVATLTAQPVIWTYLDTVVQTQRNIEAAIRDICDQAVEDDGLEFQSDSVRAEAMKENEAYEGVRVKLLARLASARISIQIDVGFGDVITPAPDDVTYPTILTFPAPILKAYPRETVVAEKFQAMAMLGIVNSRMKDFYDLWTLARQFEFSGPVLSAAIRATFERRQTPLPEQLPIALTSEFSEDRQKLMQWQAFVRKGKLDAEGITLPEVTEFLQTFLMPPSQALASGVSFDANWSDSAWR